jgi:uncharacterized damage-inducible protein DinB
MDILDRLLGHDAWTTRQVLLRSRALTDEQLDRDLAIDHGSVRATLVHVIRNMEVWTDLIAGRPARSAPAPSDRANSVAGLSARLDAIAGDFAATARGLADGGRLDEVWTDPLETPPRQRSYGGAIAHLLTHSMHHRAHLLAMLDRLGVPDLIEGDLLSWERQARGAPGAT